MNSSEEYSRGEQKQSPRRSLSLGGQLIWVLVGVVILTVFVSVFVGYVSASSELHQEIDYFLHDRADEFLGMQDDHDHDFLPGNSQQTFLNLWGEARALLDSRASALLRNDSWMQMIVYDFETDEVMRLPLGGYGFFPLPAEAIDREIAMGTKEAAYTTRKVFLEPISNIGEGAGGDALSNLLAEPGFTPDTGISGNIDGWQNTEGGVEAGNDSDAETVNQVPPLEEIAGTETLNLRIYTVQLGNGIALQIGRDLSEIDNALGDLRDRIVIVGLAVTLVAALIGWFLGRRFVKPVKQLAARAETVTETLDLAKPVDVKGSAEVAQLAISFNKMLGALDQSRERRRQLVANVSHELRTPLTSMRTNIEMLAKDIVTDPEERKVVLADTKAEIEEFTTLADELLELTRIDLSRGVQHEIESTALSLDDLAKEAAERARRQLHCKIILTAEEPQEVLCHENDLKRAVGNLLSNAVKFSPEDSPIEMNVAGTKLEVRDHGGGIHPDNLEKVFGRFYREAEARSMPGSGLGLAIVSQIIENHGGEVWAKNHPEGGAVVGFRLPAFEENGQV